MFLTFLLLDEEAKWKVSSSNRNQIGARRM
jgi:hypothetical protein